MITLDERYIEYNTIQLQTTTHKLFVVAVMLFDLNLYLFIQRREGGDNYVTDLLMIGMLWYRKHTL